MTDAGRSDRSEAAVHPFWARARIDSRALGQVTLLAYALAHERAAEDAAQRFSRAACAAAAAMVRSGEATLDLWEEPEELICCVVRGTVDRAAGPRPSEGARASRPCARRAPSRALWRFGVLVEHSDDAVTVRLAV